ncbi:uncharacterized protein LOC135401671 [Ornithodoros turicata]|uniref:uncharacterized protein LOC135401671 n=1 Tax=Ornithodoros turicata TaxID=34597 RepID=UPI00313986B3
MEADGGLRVDTSSIFLDVFGTRSEFSTFEEFSGLFVKFEKKSRYIFRVKNSSSVEAENRRRKDKIDSAIKYSGLVLCCVNCGDANKTLKKLQEGDARQLCDAHIYLRYRSSSRKLAIISSSFVHNHPMQQGTGCFHRKRSVTERIGKPRDGRRKFVKTADNTVNPLPLLRDGSDCFPRPPSELTITPLGNCNSARVPLIPPQIDAQKKGGLSSPPVTCMGNNPPARGQVHVSPPNEAGDIKEEVDEHPNMLEPECILQCYEDDASEHATDLSLKPKHNEPPSNGGLEVDMEYVVTWKELEPLFRFCSRCGSPVERTRYSLHGVLSVSAICSKGHGVFWTSKV